MRHQRIRSPQTTTQLAPESSRQMDSIALIRRLHQHRQWVNDELLNTADQLTEEQLRQPFEIGHGVETTRALGGNARRSTSASHDLITTLHQ